MKPPKDKFSTQAATYAKFRPRYPDELYDFLFRHTMNFTRAWDCGTGNGQVAEKLSERFASVHATDMSDEQLRNATQKRNITYERSRAEQTCLPDHSIDLVTAAQALHWFDLDAFYKEVKRVAKPDGTVATWGYDRPTVSPAIDPIIDELYFDILGSYWDPERKLVDEHYATIQFPFGELIAPKFHIGVKWRHEELIGYLNSWSGVQNYIRANGRNPVLEVDRKIGPHWNNKMAVRFPLFIRIGTIVRKG